MKQLLTVCTKKTGPAMLDMTIGNEYLATPIPKGFDTLGDGNYIVDTDDGVSLVDDIGDTIYCSISDGLSIIGIEETK